MYPAYKDEASVEADFERGRLILQEIATKKGISYEQALEEIVAEETAKQETAWAEWEKNHGIKLSQGHF
ncbi:hypothetical protein HZC00_02775 [Candidatus Kaiserbacteria bacterium]|nr:hypothetical protein [Candidatus Kaiserbacteria bacterium]